LSTDATTFNSTENILIFEWCYQCCYPFLKYTEGVLNLHQAWHAPNTLPTMVHGEVICTINWFALTLSHVPTQLSCLPPCCHLRTFYFEINRKKRNNHLQSDFFICDIAKTMTFTLQCSSVLLIFFHSRSISFFKNIYLYRLYC
jgi:hypothetical protein